MTTFLLAYSDGVTETFWYMKLLVEKNLSDVALFLMHHVAEVPLPTPFE